jgi:isopenicillin-N epimerase
MLYVRRDRIEHTWPLMAADEKEKADIRKFEQIGTHPAANFLAIAEALTFHEALGGARKEARLRALRQRWIDQLQDVPGFRLNSPRASVLSCGLGNFRIEGLDPGKLQAWLWDKHRILVTTITHDEFSGTRVTPQRVHDAGGSRQVL